MDNFLGELRVFACGTIPKGWVSCAGQLLSIQQNAALFSLLGTYYGGNGTSNFQLPDLRGRTMLGYGGSYVIGEAAGTEGVNLNSSQLPMHNHLVKAQNVNGAARLNANTPAKALALPIDPINAATIINAYVNTGALQPLNPAITGQTGSSQPHENRMPLLAVNICIALTGIFPSRN